MQRNDRLFFSYLQLRRERLIISRNIGVNGSSNWNDSG